MYHPQLSKTITQTVSRLQTELVQAAPATANSVLPWMGALAGSDQPDRYFKHPAAFPFLLLPWWLEESIRGKPDTAFQADLIYSAINGYYYIRLIDNLMDGHATTELQFLPVLGFFHTQFQIVYQRYFTGEAPFWDLFKEVWFQSAEAAIKDGALIELDEKQFEQTAAQKSCAAKIPLVAVCCRYHRPDLIQPWFQWVDLFGCWHQFFNDLFDWPRDHTRQNCTFFLSEAERRRNKDELVAGWVAREGFEWAIEKLQGWMSALRRSGSALNSPALIAYLDTRQRMILKQQQEVAQGLQALAKIIGTGI